LVSATKHALLRPQLVRPSMQPSTRRRQQQHPRRHLQRTKACHLRTAVKTVLSRRYATRAAASTCSARRAHSMPAHIAPAAQRCHARRRLVPAVRPVLPAAAACCQRGMLRPGAVPTGVSAGSAPLMPRLSCCRWWPRQAGLHTTGICLRSAAAGAEQRLTQPWECRPAAKPKGVPCQRTDCLLLGMHSQ